MICLICVQNYTKKYGDKTVVNDISFTAKDGAITGFIGHNGAGKSTTIKAITGVIRPTSGSITKRFHYDQRDRHSEGRKKGEKSVWLCFRQSRSLFETQRHRVSEFYGGYL